MPRLALPSGAVISYREARPPAPRGSPLNGPLLERAPPLNGPLLERAPPLNGPLLERAPPLNGPLLERDPPLNGPLLERAPPLLLLHGAGGSSRSFAEILGRLLPLGQRVIAPDLPGHGGSPGLSGRSHPRALLERYCDVVAELGEALGLGRFVLAGHSMGGAIGQLFALAYPERLAGLVLIATAARLEVSPALLQAIRKRFDQLPDLLAEAGFSPATASHQARAWATRQVQAAQEVTLDDFEACCTFDLRDRVGAVSCPTLVISGADDRLTPPRLQQRLAEQIHRGRWEAISRAGHFLMWERPGRLAALLWGQQPVAAAALTRG